MRTRYNEILPRIIVILGPTASGKSDLAVRLARKFNGEVISADSRQVYKGLDIGTGKITKREMRNVAHHMLDVASPRRQFTVANYTKKARKVIENILKKGKLPIICGGTGFYVSALLGEVQLPGVPPNPKLRKLLEKKNVSELFQILKKLNPARAATIDRYNPRRLIRAIEIAKESDRLPKLKAKSYKLEAIKIGIKVENEELKKKINKRLVGRIKRGMIAEAKKLRGGGLSYKRMRELGLEYRRLADFLENKITKQELLSLLQNEIWQYAKRQMTWFKRDKDIVWFSPSNSTVISIIRKFI